MEIKDHFRAKLRVTPKIEFHDIDTINALQHSKLGRKPIQILYNYKIL